jgi:Holliday junction resolvase RusA-like endonuclease
MDVSKMTYCGHVRGQGRPRFGVSGNTYEAAEDRAYKAALRAAYKAQGGRHYGDAPVAVTILAYSPLPKSRPKRVEAEPFTQMPDADNIAKAVLDALQGAAYDNDKQVTKLIVVKKDRVRGLEEGLRVYVRKVD